jgi:hypothetical protein
MKRKLIIFTIALLPAILVAQDKVSLNFAQVFSGFKFIDSQGKKDELMTSEIKYSYALNYETDFNSGFYIKPEIGYKNLGAKSIVNNTKLEWNLHYIDVNFGGGYMIKAFRLKPYLGAAFYYAYMYKGDQTVGSESFDLISSQALSTSDYGINLNLGLRYDFSEALGVFFEYQNNIGLCQLDQNLNGGNKELYNRASSIHFGLAFSIIKNDMKDSSKK